MAVTLPENLNLELIIVLIVAFAYIFFCLISLLYRRHKKKKQEKEEMQEETAYILDETGNLDPYAMSMLKTMIKEMELDLSLLESIRKMQETYRNS